MKRLPAPYGGWEASFFEDPEALGCLLHEVIEIANNTKGGEILIGEICESARGLGYRGSASRVRRHLLHHGFLSEVTRGERYRLEEENREVIDYFFRKHERLFERKGLNILEKALVFEYTSPKGTEVEKVFMRVMHAITFMLDELSHLPELESNARADLAMHEFEHFCIFERVKWCNEYTESLKARVDNVCEKCGSGSEEFREVFCIYVSHYMHLEDLIAHASEQNEQFKTAIHDMERIALLKDIRIFLIRFSRIIAKKEMESP